MGGPSPQKTGHATSSPGDNDHLGVLQCYDIQPGGGGRGTPYSGLYGEAPPERGTFFRLQVYKRVGISQVEVYKRVEGISAM